MITIITILDEIVTVVFPDKKKSVEFSIKEYGEMALSDILAVTENWAEKKDAIGKNGRNRIRI